MLLGSVLLERNRTLTDHQVFLKAFFIYFVFNINCISKNNEERNCLVQCYEIHMKSFLNE